MWNVAKIKLNYYMGKVYKLAGKCWNCGEYLNFTRHGQGVCPCCKKRY